MSKDYSIDQAIARLDSADALVIKEFLLNNTWNSIPSGYTFLSERVGVVKLNMDQPIELANKLEYHLTKIDVHYLYDGEDEIRLKPKMDCSDENRTYSPEEDYGLFSDSPTQVVKLTKKEALYIGPEIAHMALCGTGTVKKLVFKINVDA